MIRFSSTLIMILAQRENDRELLVTSHPVKIDMFRLKQLLLVSNEPKDTS
jgi:hypothetical protein